MQLSVSVCAAAQCVRTPWPAAACLQPLPFPIWSLLYIPDAKGKHSHALRMPSCVLLAVVLTSNIGKGDNASYIENLFKPYSSNPKAWS